MTANTASNVWTLSDIFFTAAVCGAMFAGFILGAVIVVLLGQAVCEWLAFIIAKRRRDPWA